ncbi:MAG: hypothetical protein WA709_30385 [Stellaceae bacterium]
MRPRRFVVFALRHNEQAQIRNRRKARATSSAFFSAYASGT